MNTPSSSYFFLGDQRIEIAKVPDRFTVRMNRGEQSRSVSQNYACEHANHLGRQRLDEFAADSSQIDRVMDQVRNGKEVAFASHVYHTPDQPEVHLYLTEEVTLKFEDNCKTETIEELMDEHGLELLKRVIDGNQAYVFRLTERARENPIKLTNRLRDLDVVVMSEVNMIVPMLHFHIPSETHYSDQWHLYHEGGIQLAENAHVDAERAWEISRGDRSIVVAVTDDSVDLRHRDFEGEGKIVGARDFMGQDFEPLPELETDNHGTACAGVAVAEENGHGVVGIAPRCALMPIRTSGYLDDNSIEELFTWCSEQGADIISCSWGPSVKNFPLSLRQSQALSAAATRGRDGKGCVIVFASGNANRPINEIIQEDGWPRSSQNGPKRWHDGYAVHPDVIAVSACTSLNKKSAYSNWGSEISVCAPSNNAHPGVGNKPTYPLLHGINFRGRGIVTTDRIGSTGYSRSDYTFQFGGTSSACPLVAGIAALVLSVNPELTARQVREILESTTDKIVDNQRDPQLGHSFGQYDQNGHSKWFGYGKVNAFKAVKRALELKGGGETDQLQFVSRPELDIPDNDSQGISDRIQVDHQGILKAISVDVDITHSYRGDLRVHLFGPSGDSVVLHDRKGGSATDLQQTYAAADMPALNVFVGKSMKGEWRLEIRDLADQDIGKLNSWDLNLKVEPEQDLILEEALGITIPDDDPAGITRTLRAEEEGKVGDISVAIDVSHTYIGDLSINLETPSGTLISLHNREAGSADNIIKTYTIANRQNLSFLRGESIKGDWKLHCSDHAGADVGKLNRWKVTIRPQV